MRGCLGWLILLPFAGAWWLTIKIIDACIKKGGVIRLLGILVCLIVGGGSLVAGYFIGPIVGWFIMAVGGLVIIIGTWRSMVVTKEQVVLEEQTETLKKESEQEEQEREEAITLSKKWLEYGKIDNVEKFNKIYIFMDKRQWDRELKELFDRLKELRNT